MSGDRKSYIIETSKKIMESIDKYGVNARLLGGVAIYLTCPSAGYSPLAREINDIDIVLARNTVKEFKKVMAEHGFEPDQQFNGIHGESRMLFYKTNLEIDVFIGKFIQCHELNLEEDLLQCKQTINLANLLLTKLQIIQINYKDILDILALLVDHPVEKNNNCNNINIDKIIDVVRKDWGWFTTVSDNLDRTISMAKDILDKKSVSTIEDKINFIKKSIEESPKSIKWKLRSKIGRKIQWYNLPEEK